MSRIIRPTIKSVIIPIPPREDDALEVLTLLVNSNLFVRSDTIGEYVAKEMHAGKILILAPVDPRQIQQIGAAYHPDSPTRLVKLLYVDYSRRKWQPSYEAIELSRVLPRQ